MISVRLYGRMGNQMFQIATCIATALRNKTDFNIPRRTISPRTWGTYFTFPARLQSGGRIWKEIGHEYRPIPNEKKLILDGYFQSEKYFKDYRTEVINSFGFQWNLIPDSVSVHVRRGDYLTLQDKHPVVSIDYINESMNYFFHKGYKNFTFFSDDINWCRDHFPGHRYSEGNTEKKDMELMSCHQHHIIANSSFSWWGAWLNRNPDKIVIAPAQWFGEWNKHLDTKDMYCDGWLKMNQKGEFI